MNSLQTGALAVTLIICIPILLGFGMATESVERTVSTESVDRNLSDLVLNSETEYFADYTGPANNSMFVQEVIAQGGVSYLSAAPDYVSVGSTYTSIPTYSSGTSTLALDSGTTTTHSGSSTNSVTVGTDSTSGAVYNNDLVRVANTSGVMVQTTYYVGTSPTYDLTYATGDYVFYRSGTYSGGQPLYTMIMPDSTVVENVHDFNMYSDQSPTFTVYHRQATTVDLEYTYYTMTARGSHAVIPITHADSSSEYVTVDSLDSLIYSSTHLYVNDEIYYSVSSFGLCLPFGYSQITYTYNTMVQNEYADPSLGWDLPEYTESSYTGYYNYWTNGMVNDSVTFDLNFTTYGTVVFEIVDGLGNSAVRTVTLVYSSGGTSVTVSGVEDGAADLGSYSHIRVVLESDSVTVSGMKEWTYIGGDPDTYNSVSWDCDNGTFTFVRMTPIGAPAHFRVSDASILAGTFPSTEDFALNLYSYYPSDAKQGVGIDSVGIYGDYLTIGGVQYPVSDGKITVTDADTGDSVTVSVLRAVITFEKTETNYGGLTVTSYTTSVDGHKVSTSSSAPQLVFGGEWVLTLHRVAYNEETVVSEEWQPGEFAFDEDDFILAMILASVGVFVALGLMKGVRIGVLLVVCSAAGIIAFIIA